MILILFMFKINYISKVFYLVFILMTNVYFLFTHIPHEFDLSYSNTLILT